MIKDSNSEEELASEFCRMLDYAMLAIYSIDPNVYVDLQEELKTESLLADFMSLRSANKSRKIYFSPSPTSLKKMRLIIKVIVETLPNYPEQYSFICLLIILYQNESCIIGLNQKLATIRVSKSFTAYEKLLIIRFESYITRLMKTNFLFNCKEKVISDHFQYALESLSFILDAFE
uniref:transport system ATPase n=1 Tax=Haramonas pauciplastida TaxID=478668 RepID=UPI002115511B|nr:transport system ATPase [Haramonas pauciplastida]UTE94937.1 transport system ATPase [Haramonas pauciplastida]